MFNTLQNVLLLKIFCANSDTNLIKSICLLSNSGKFRRFLIDVGTDPSNDKSFQDYILNSFVDPQINSSFVFLYFKFH